MLYFHSVTLDKEKCHGCTNCIKKCPTEAIRVRGGKAKIIKERCIDCGECIRICPYHAKLAVTDEFSELENYKYNIAMPAPSFYGQFKYSVDRNRILTAFTLAGFDDVFEVAVGAQYATMFTNRIISEGNIKTPVISSACPAVIRLIRERFPDLIGNIINILSPMEISAMLAREEAKKKTGLSDDEIGVFFITPCPAKVTSIKSPLTLNKSNVNGAISASDAYLKIYPLIKKVTEVKEFAVADYEGISWGRSGGESESVTFDGYIAVDGINNVINILEEIEDEKIEGIDFVELSACTGGCVGGPLNLTNAFVSEARIKNMSDNKKNKLELKQLDINDFLWENRVESVNTMQLDEDFSRAMKKMEQIETLYSNMPKLDCGSCGAPSCKALAEDVIRGFGNENDCIFKMRERVRELARELFDLEGQPYGLHNEDKDKSEVLSIK